MTRFPKCSAFMDDLKAAFGDDQVIPVWAEENGNRVGRRDDSIVSVQPSGNEVYAREPVVEQTRTRYRA